MPEPGRVLLRTTCGAQTGLGHYRRCLTLAEALRRRGVDAALALASDTEGRSLSAGESVPLIPIAERPEEPTTTLRIARERRAELVLVDDYSFVEPGFTSLDSAGFSTAVIEDTAERQLPVDLLINGAAGAERLSYATRASTRRLLGPSYALLREAFSGLAARTAPPAPRRVLVMFGGSDPRGLSSSVASLVRAHLPLVEVDVVLGPLAPPWPRPLPGVSVHVAPAYLSSLMLSADLAISAAGQTLYELAAAGVPTIAIEIADNQRPQLAALVEAGVVSRATTEEAQLSRVLVELAGDQAARQAQIDLGQRLIDGRGADRVAEAIERLLAERRASA